MPTSRTLIEISFQGPEISSPSTKGPRKLSQSSENLHRNLQPILRHRIEERVYLK